MLHNCQTLRLSLSDPAPHHQTEEGEKEAGLQVCALTDTFAVPGLWGDFGDKFLLLGLLLVTGLIPLLLLPLLAKLGLDHGLGVFL